MLLHFVTINASLLIFQKNLIQSNLIPTSNPSVSTKPSLKPVSKATSVINNFITKIKAERLKENSDELKEISKVVKQGNKATVETTTQKPKKVDKEVTTSKEDSLDFLSDILDAIEKQIDDSEKESVEDIGGILDMKTSALLNLIKENLAPSKPKIVINAEDNFQDDLEKALKESQKIGKELRGLLNDFDY